MSDARVNGTTLHYEAHGAGPAVLFIHGFTLDGRMWRPQLESLARRHRVIVYDSRGFGRSAMPGTEPYRHCDDAAALCEHLGLERVTVVGHSIGAHHGLELALTRPDLVVAWGGICSSGLAGIPFPDDIRALFKTLRAMSQAGEVAAAKELWGRCGWFAPTRERPELAREIDAMLEQYSAWHWLHPNTAATVEPPVAGRLGELDRPALVLTGARDLAYNAAVGRALLAGLRGATAVHVESAGHLANLEAPEVVSEAIAALVERASARGSGRDARGALGA